MKLKRLKAVLFMAAILLLGLVQQSCNDDNQETARVQLILVDDPGDYLEVNVQIIDIQYNTTDSEEGWQSFAPASGYPINVDLTQLIAGNSLLLADQIIPAGMLKQIRLVLSDNNTLKIDGEAELIHLETPSAMQSGLKLNLNEVLEPGFSYTFILDWVVQESVVESGASGIYNLKPVIRVNAEVNSGSVSGNVFETIEAVQTPKPNVTVEVYDDGDVFVTDSQTDDNGNFLIQGLGAGTYKLKIVQAGYQDYLSGDFMVTVGEVYDAGSIELLQI